MGNYLDQLKKFKSLRFSSAYIAKIAILTAVSFLLYGVAKFNLPFMFPSFLEFQISELPALLAGFSMGPVSACLVIIIKCLLKFPLTGTAFVGESTDILLGVLFVLPASVIYQLRKDRKHALIGIVVGSACLSFGALLVNRFISVPFYVQAFFGGNFNALLDIVRPLYKDVTQESFYNFYLWLGVLPFNLLRCAVVGLLTFLVYKQLSKILHWEGTSLHKHPLYSSHKVRTQKQTDALAAKLADTLEGGEVILLSGELGAGKTTFTKGLAKALGVQEEVTSPTFTILNVYESGRLKLNHLDMYRVESEDELYELGIEDVFDDCSVTVIEWNKIESIPAKKIIKIDISVISPKERKFDISTNADDDEDGEDNQAQTNDDAKEEDCSQNPTQNEDEQ